jgi:hypothetical protein
MELARVIKMGLDHIVLDPRDMLEGEHWRWIMTLHHLDVG